MIPDHMGQAHPLVKVSRQLLSSPFCFALHDPGLLDMHTADAAAVAAAAATANALLPTSRKPSDCLHLVCSQ